MKQLPSILCIAILAITSGCATMKPTLPEWLPVLNSDTVNESTEPAEPTSFAVLWKDSVYEKPGSPSVRGFGGRVFIYDANNEPIKAEGELIVYGYDESNTAREDSGADKKFVFPSKQFQRHYSESDLGHSYSVWVPWEKVGGVRKSITLIPVFKTASGKLIRSGQSINVLPGKKPASTDNVVAHASGSAETPSRNVIAQASFDRPPADMKRLQPVAAGKATEIKRAGLRTTTLNLPPALAKKMAQPIQAAVQAKPPIEATVSTPAVPTAHEATADAAPASSEPSPTKTEARIFGVPGAF